MEFLFRISPCDAPGLEEETAELLRQRLEAGSREAWGGFFEGGERWSFGLRQNTIKKD